MADYNIQPFYRGGEPSFPLQVSPYHSRVEEQELDIEEGFNLPKNYQFIAFRPGFALQASELNEMQEHFQMQLSLSIAMMHNWITSGIGTHWGSYDQDNSGGEGSVAVPTFVPENGIGVGGVAPSGILGDSQYAISGPGWRGSCPLHPYHQTYNPGDGANSFPVTASWAGSSVRLDFWSGWWLVEITDTWDPGNAATSAPGPADVSGLKHWVYLTAIDSTTPLFSVQVPADSGDIGEAVVGFRLASTMVDCSEDVDLGDNANGSGNPAACGADRYVVSVQAADYATSSADGTWSDSETEFRQKLSLICKVNPSEGTVRYMNNLLISQR